MNTTHRFGLALGFVLLAAIASLVAAPDLPDQFVTNWDAGGEPDGTMSTAIGLWLLPAMTAGLVGLFALLPRIDPLRENITAFRPYYDWFVVVFAAYMTLLHVGMVAFNLGYEFDFTLLVLAGMIPLFYYVGVVLEQAKRNWFIGIRTPWTLSSDEVWDRTNALGATLFKWSALVALVGLVGGYVSGQIGLAFAAMFVPLLVTAFVPVAYSYYLYRDLESGDPSAV
ncbi:SdpI family protein [Natranaeroarchaeum aerophilus]|uniref:SdpI family protein n=1 Tax=Natranaeroarchaeum aerophilus TaxID=2917711 RepID=A0AAE3FSD4_9EURY|nr:SdpI family protein [Natranaeroarchaeum aerophilus]MCL9813649.1 SdpI family protein [Natranaeroarchaeum aerophilus]